jgi:MoxR-like ATPase
MEVQKMAKKILTESIIESVEKLHSIEKELSSYIVGREELLKVITIGIVGKRNVFVLGDKGQAKSYAFIEYTKRITDTKFFKTLMNKMMDKDELFGRLDIPSLVKGDVKLIIDGKIPDSNFNFLDEIFKSNDIILNTLLEVLNYEDITLEGKRVTLPLISNFCASNEIPDFNKNEEAILAPLYDRLHLKVVTNYINNIDDFKRAVNAKREHLNNIGTTISMSEIRELNDIVDNIKIPSEIDDIFWNICEEIKKNHNKEISDRKKIEYSKLVQSVALLNKRDTVVPEDLKVLEWYLWDRPEEIDSFKQTIKKFADNPIKNKCSEFSNMAIQVVAESVKDAPKNLKAKNKAFIKAESELFSIFDSLKELKTATTSLTDEKIVKESIDTLSELYKNLTEKFEYSPMPIDEARERCSR